MVRINRLCPNPDVNIVAKLEGFNPTGSIKDRIAIAMVEQAEQEGKLYPGKTIIEPTSGNTGIGLAIAGIVKGYPVEIVMSSAVSIERRKIIASYGGKVILTPADQGTDGAIRLAHKLVNENPDKYYMPDQFSNAGNYMAHYKNTAIEIWQQMEGRIDYFVGAIGTSGTLMGLTKFLKIMDPSILDSQEMIESEEAIAMARRIIREEGIFAGMSSGAAMLAALRTAEKIKSGNIVVIFPDRAEKYLSTSMFDNLG